MSQTVYLMLRKMTDIRSQVVRLGDAAKILCQDETIENHLKAMKILRISSGKRRRYVMEVTEILKMIQDELPSVQVENLGETSFIIAYKPSGTENPVWQWTKTVFVCLVSFCGAAFAIMTFNNDVSAADVFQKVHLLIMGTESDGFSVLEVSYCIGLALGIVVFFNHVAAKKLNTYPTPLEVEMRLYEDNISKTLIANADRKESKIDTA